MRKTLLALLLFAVSALGADFSGNWSGEGVADGQSHPVYIVMKQDGASLTGTFGPDAARQIPFQNGKIDGDKITFDLVDPKGGKIHFDLKGDAEGLKGTIEFKREDTSQSATVSLKKAA